MARHEGKFEAAEELEVGFSDVLVDPASSLSERDRQEAIICYLTRSEGWQAAFKLLGGAFASDRKGSQG